MAVTLSVENAIAGRRSVRQFLSLTITRETIEEILIIASRAPSGSNIQPWKVHVLQDAAKLDLENRLMFAYDRGDLGAEEYQYYPSPWREPYLARRRKVGWDLYSLLGIDRSDKKGMSDQLRRNFNFFGAPVGLIFTIDRDLPVGSWLDYGMFLQNIMIAARAKGLETCPQQAFAAYHKIIRSCLGLADTEIVICGMALGFADWSATVNKLVTQRIAPSEFAIFY
ncbi:nitroreductase [Agrobacterium tumefaciens]|uniref:Nitroreductase domain-containing protein n=1 Tax=Agrobacterium tumefaciens TaxID=358 RepID=A0A176XF84_AGRTU|nr:nitroreductase [Agrobacterium tumefaciens]OAE48208.1 hypothetical protein A7J57_22665 [Agrobacterium tumefaciens]